MREKLSAMMDGECGDQDLDALIAEIDGDEACGRAWREYHLISDVLAGQPLASDCFLLSFHERLAAEPTILAPTALRLRTTRPLVLRRRWVALSMAASVAVVSATIWHSAQPAAGMISGATYVAENQVAQPVDEQVSPYLVAHQDMLGNPGFEHRAVLLNEADAEAANTH